MNDIKERLIKHFEESSSAPFLFIGSGFSKRYLNLDNWEDLLKRFTVNLLKPYEFYKSTANGNMSEVASLIAEDFHSVWWEHPDYKSSRETIGAELIDKTSALRVEICNHINSLSNQDLEKLPLQEEIQALLSLNVDGIITTNWDTFLERIFSNYKVYIGQSELLFSHPQSIGEIYKIHGSANKPSSLVLTKNDYDLFEKQNAYLAAKLITLFVEHPIVFIGY